MEILRMDLGKGLMVFFDSCLKKWHQYCFNAGQQGGFYVRKKILTRTRSQASFTPHI
jgi:hypothetical protein